MPDFPIPGLTVSGFKLGPRQAPIDLGVLLYAGAASAFQGTVQRAIEKGEFGQPERHRIPMLMAIHRQWQAGLSDGSMSVGSVRTFWSVLRSFVRFAEDEGRPLTTDNLLDLYLSYCEDCKRRTDLKDETRYAYSNVLASQIAPLLGLDSTKLQWKTKIRWPYRLGNHAAKENLQATTSFIRILLETISQLGVSAIRGPLPVTLRYPGDREHSIHCGAPLVGVEHLKGDRSHIRRGLLARERRATDTSNEARAALVNLRLDAEMLIFINQTAGNLTQVLRLKGGQFRYRSDGAYLHVLVWKGRAKHSVGLRVHKAYRAHFESYLAWRNEIFPGDPEGLTFPFIWNDGEKALERSAWAFDDARKLMKSIGEPFVNTRQLRKTAGNFVKRRTSRQIAAELLGNSVRTFRETYEEVDHQGAASELVSFWQDAEAAMVSAVGPGACSRADPQRLADAPEGAPLPDCEGAAGCLFCDKNRDLRSFDHVWNLASLYHLKLEELNADRVTDARMGADPVELAVRRIAAKIEAFETMGAEMGGWVTEAKLRVGEGRYHPFYTETFQLLGSAQ